MDRLDEERLEMLRTWGEGLLKDDRDELRAAGRAIMMLVEEIERLHVDLWHASQDAGKKAEIQGDESEGPRRQLGLALQRRISALWSRGLSGSVARLQQRLQCFPNRKQRTHRFQRVRVTPRVGLEPTTLRLTAGCSAN